MISRSSQRSDEKEPAAGQTAGDEPTTLIHQTTAERALRTHIHSDASRPAKGRMRRFVNKNVVLWGARHQSCTYTRTPHPTPEVLEFVQEQNQTIYCRIRRLGFGVYPLLEWVHRTSIEPSGEEPVHAAKCTHSSQLRVGVDLHNMLMFSIACFAPDETRYKFETAWLFTTTLGCSLLLQDRRTRWPIERYQIFCTSCGSMYDVEVVEQRQISVTGFQPKAHHDI